MFFRALCIHKGSLANVSTLRFLGSTYVQRSSIAANNDGPKVVCIQDSAALEEHRKKVELLLKEDLPKPYDGPERDLVNFPRRPRVEEPAKVRMGFLPDDWFTYFYPKTGVTGPYVFGTGLITFLVSKEWYVIEHEFSTGCACFFLIYIAIKKFGPATAKFRDSLVQEDVDYHEGTRKTHLKHLEDNKEEQRKNVWQAEGQKILMEAKRENVQMQLETEYRRRMMHVYEEVKKRLDYQLDYLNTRRKLEQKHMVDWIVNNVVKSITPQQEKEALQKCIEDLKVLSTKTQ